MNLNALAKICDSMFFGNIVCVLYDNIFSDMLKCCFLCFLNAFLVILNVLFCGNTVLSMLITYMYIRMCIAIFRVLIL